MNSKISSKNLTSRLIKIAFISCLPVLIPEGAISQNKMMCITIDDLPIVSYGIEKVEYEVSIIEGLLTACERYGTTATGFVNEYKLYRQGRLNPDRLRLLSIWLDRGHDLGNHAYSHKDYHKVSFDEYTSDILLGEKVSRPLVEEYHRPFKYFRHPYLRIGLSAAKHDSLKVFLARHGYIEAPVSIDNDDYLFAKAYHNALQSKQYDTAKKIGQDFLGYMQTKLLFYEATSQSLFGRSIRHILLLHASKLNADYLKNLLQLFTEHGYSFITLDEALEDVAYARPITKYGPWGISWLDRWALSQGEKGDFFAGDPPAPAYIKEWASR